MTNKTMGWLRLGLASNTAVKAASNTVAESANSAMQAATGVSCSEVLCELSHLAGTPWHDFGQYLFLVNFALAGLLLGCSFIELLLALRLPGLFKLHLTLHTLSFSLQLPLLNLHQALQVRLGYCMVRAP